MNILLLCDREGAGAPQKTLEDALARAGHQVESIALRQKELMPCLGCFGCWFKTPGQCVMKDDKANDIACMEMRSDAIILLSKITYGGFSADIKAFLDRSIQNILPYFEIYEGEMHHVMRYKRFPIWIAIGYGDVPDAERQTFCRLAERNAINMRPPHHLALIVQNDTELAGAGKAILEKLEVGA